MAGFSAPTREDDPIHVVRTIGRLAQMLIEFRDEYERRPRPDTLAQIDQRLNDLAVEFLVEPFDQAADLGAENGIAVDHRHSVDGLVEIFDDRLRANERDALVGLDHDRGLTSGIEVHELVAALPRILAHQLMRNALLAED